MRLVLPSTPRRIQSPKRAAKDHVALELIYVSRAAFKSFAVGSGCVPGIHYIADTGPNKLAKLLSGNLCCLVVDHRQGGKTTLAALAAKQLHSQFESCYVVELSGVKVGPTIFTTVNLTRRKILHAARPLSGKDDVQQNAGTHS